MSATWQTTAVHIRRPPGVLLSEFFAVMRMWLDHHCIILADFRVADGVFDALFDNPRDARLFERRFAAQSTSIGPAHITPLRPVAVVAPSKEMPVLGGPIPVGSVA